MAAWATADCERGKQTRSVYKSAAAKAEQMTGGGKLQQHPPTTARKAAWMTTPVAITSAEEMKRDTLVEERTSIVQRFRFLLRPAALLCMYQVDSSDNAGIPGHPKHLVVWAVRLVSPLADSACSRNRPACAAATR